MLYVFNTHDAVEIAWNGEVPAVRRRASLSRSFIEGARGLVRSIRTRSAG